MIDVGTKSNVDKSEECVCTASDTTFSTCFCQFINIAVSKLCVIIIIRITSIKFSEVCDC